LPPVDPIVLDSVHGDDTVVAISTPPGRGGIGIVRLSGARAVEISSALVAPGSKPLEARRVGLRTLADAEGETVEQALLTLFTKPSSYTGEDIVEISCHGSPVLLGFVVQRALAAGARMAEPGELTLRAVRNGRLDLTQAEAVRDLIDATTLYQARVAYRQLEGALAHRLNPLKDQLTELIALLEAGIDFAEDDVETAPPEEILRRLDPLREGVATLAESYRWGKLVHEGFTLAILGPPNVGKSSLFNRLLEKDRAIVAPQAGTTRDVVSETANIEGLPVKLLDTAGVRESDNIIEAQGVERSYEALADADLTLVVVDGSAPLSDTETGLVKRARRAGRFLLVANKSDLKQAELPEEWLRVSAKTGQGLPELRSALRDAAAPGADSDEAGFVTSLRQERLLRECLNELERARQAVVDAVPHEMLLLDLYGALAPIDAVTGATTIEDILGSIFSTFCIGK